jgi:hypothetical protein
MLEYLEQQGMPQPQEHQALYEGHTSGTQLEGVHHTKVLNGLQQHAGVSGSQALLNPEPLSSQDISNRGLFNPKAVSRQGLWQLVSGVDKDLQLINLEDCTSLSAHRAQVAPSGRPLGGASV